MLSAALRKFRAILLSLITQLRRRTSKEETMNAQMLRDGIFNLQTRRFGTVAEVMIRRLFKLGKSKNQFHDLYDDLANHRVEVKFSTVRKKNNRVITEDSVLKCISDELALNRHVLYSKWRENEFDCNIQQVKRSEFDVLYYGLFFSEAVAIFRIESKDIGSQIYYSDKQHKGNEGEGQFHLNDNTLQIHLDKYLYKLLSYQELLDLLE